MELKALSVCHKFILFWFSLSVLTPGAYAVIEASNIADELRANPWWQSGRKALSQRKAVQLNYAQAKNVILFIADGMGISTITAARIYDGQSKGRSGEENSLSFERFPHTALIKTYGSDAQITGSAATASAMNSGVKVPHDMINWQGEKVCDGSYGDLPSTLAQLAVNHGKFTGVVSTDRITSATPAAVYGHVPNRKWQSESRLPRKDRQRGCVSLAHQMLQFNQGRGLQVMLGGGRKAFTTDQGNLIDAWQRRNGNAVYVQDALSFRVLQPQMPGPLLGLFADSHMDYEVDRNDREQPSLAEMTDFAIDALGQNNRGYYLMVEGALIDHAHHDTNAFRALSDTQAFAQAVQVAVNKVKLEETLILVTADHSHTFVLAGYSRRGNPILGLARKNNKLSLAADGKPYTTLGYYTGPNARTIFSAILNNARVLNPDYQQQSAVPREDETHGGEDVALFAVGPKSHLVGGVLEQHVIFHIIAEAFGWQLYGQ